MWLAGTPALFDRFRELAEPMLERVSVNRVTARSLASLPQCAVTGSRFRGTTTGWRRRTTKEHCVTDALLKTEDQEEALSRVNVRAIAARSGYMTATPSPDRGGVDLRIQAGGEMSPALDLQLKATVNLKRLGDGCVRFRLKSSDHNRLCCQTQTPSYLVVLDLPRDRKQWITITANELVLRHRAYWQNLQRNEKTKNEQSITIRIPEGNRFTVESLRRLMEVSRRGTIP